MREQSVGALPPLTADVLSVLRGIECVIIHLNEIFLISCRHFNNFGQPHGPRTFQLITFTRCLNSCLFCCFKFSA